MSEFLSNIRTRVSAVVNEMATAISPRLQRRNTGASATAGGASNGGEAGTADSSSGPQQQQQLPHINDIFRLPESEAAAAAAPAPAAQPMDGDGGEDDNFEPAPPPTATQLRRRSGRRSQEDGETAATPPPRPTPPSTAGVRSGSGGVGGGGGPGGRRLSSIEMTVQNEDGEAEEVEIDVADTEDDVVAPLAKDNQRCRRQPIADRISRRRNSEVAADIIRMSAAHRRREFAALIDEHQAIVRELEGQKPQAPQPQQQQQHRPDKENIGRPNR